VRGELTRARLRALLREIARTAPRGRDHRVYLVGGGTAVLLGWRASTIDADLHGADDAVFRDVQAIKERLDVNVEFVRPERFVPALRGSDARHVFVETIGRVSFHHYDPYAQTLSKVVRGFDRDLDDARRFVTSGMVEPAVLRALVAGIPTLAWAKYPRLTAASVTRAVEGFLSEFP
jgi:hypothetical protein